MANKWGQNLVLAATTGLLAVTTAEPAMARRCSVASDLDPNQMAVVNEAKQRLLTEYGVNPSELGDAMTVTASKPSVMFPIDPAAVQRLRARVNDSQQPKTSTVIIQTPASNPGALPCGNFGKGPTEATAKISFPKR